MGCGSSTTDASVAADAYSRPPKSRAKTSSISSFSSTSSGVSSYKPSKTRRQGSERADSRVTRDTRDLNQNKQQEEQQSQWEERLLAEHQLFQAQEEEQHGQQRPQAEEAEKRRQEEAQAQEEKRRQEEAQAQEEKRRQEEAQAQEEKRRQEEAHAEAAKKQQKEQAQAEEETQQESQAKEGRSFSPPEIAKHNAETGWVEWIPYKGKVYDGNGVKNHFITYMKNRQAMLEARARQRVADGAEEEETEFVTFTEHIVMYGLPPVHSSEAWKYNGVMVLRAHRVSEEELAKEMPPFYMGNITGTKGAPYWTNVRGDVQTLIGELQNTSQEDTTPGEQEYLQVLTRWQEKYKYDDPSEKPRPSDGKDPNEIEFSLPVDPDALRVWVLDWQSFDLEVPSEGVWSSLELEEVDLGDPHEIFAASLRPDSGLAEFVFNIEGEAVWDVLPDSAIKDEVMTPEQTEIQTAREKRKDFNDPERMKKRREELCDYFIKKHELAPALVMPFLQWATIMEANMAELEKLSNE